MKENIKVDAIIVPTSSGAKAVYQVKVYGQDGLPTDTKSTTDYAEARDFFENAKLEQSSVTLLMENQIRSFRRWIHGFNFCRSENSRRPDVFSAGWRFFSN
jgi:hypothetical protein